MLHNGEARYAHTHKYEYKREFSEKFALKHFVLILICKCDASKSIHIHTYVCMSIRGLFTAIVATSHSPIPSHICIWMYICDVFSYAMQCVTGRYSPHQNTSSLSSFADGGKCSARLLPLPLP